MTAASTMISLFAEASHVFLSAKRKTSNTKTTMFRTFALLASIFVSFRHFNASFKPFSMKNSVCQFKPYRSFRKSLRTRLSQQIKPFSLEFSLKENHLVECVAICYFIPEVLAPIASTVWQLFSNSLVFEFLSAFPIMPCSCDR